MAVVVSNLVLLSTSNSEVVRVLASFYYCSACFRFLSKFHHDQEWRYIQAAWEGGLQVSESGYQQWRYCFFDLIE